MLRTLKSAHKLTSHRHLSTHSTQILTALELSPLSSRGSPLSGVYNGSWLNSRGGTIGRSVNPSTGETLAYVREATAVDVESTLVAARAAQTLWRTVPAPRRGEVLRLIGDRLREKKDALGDLVSLEMGKIRSEGRGEVQEFCDIVDFGVGQSRSMPGGTVVPSERRKHFIMEVANPLGVMGCVTSFNFPVAVYGWNFSLSLVAGNANIWKPSPTTPLCAIATTKIIASVLEEQGLPGALSSLLCGGGEVGKTLVQDKRVDLLSFTGSEERGRQVGVAVAERFGQSILELGGNNAAIVLKDANLPLALRTILFSSLGTTGQRCTTTRRLFLDSSLPPSFLESLVKAYESTLVRIGNPLEEGVLVGPLHSKDGVHKFQECLKEAQEQGGRILVGGKVREMQGWMQGGNWVEPTIVLMNTGKEEVMMKESFVPILFVTAFSTLEEAIELNNSVPQGLSSSLFTSFVIPLSDKSPPISKRTPLTQITPPGQPKRSSLSSAFHWLGPTGSDTGIVNVNGSTSGAEIGAPFGGNKNTGWGRESGGDAFKKYLRWSSCTINWSEEVAMAQGVKFE